jgi:hypothetical protein
MGFRLLCSSYPQSDDTILTHQESGCTRASTASTRTERCAGERRLSCHSATGAWPGARARADLFLACIP